MRGVSREPGTITPTEAASGVSVTDRVQLVVSVTKRLDCAGVWRVSRESTVTSVGLVTTTSQTAEPATVTQTGPSQRLASKTTFPLLKRLRSNLLSRDGVCQCNSSGECPCKRTAVGKKCASCQPGYFGLSQLSSEGCTKCFCFGRSGDCDQAPYSWTQVTAATLV